MVNESGSTEKGGGTVASGVMRVNLVDYFGRTKHRSLAVAAQYFHHVLSRGREGAVLVSL